ncbi:hypothetical protein SLS62_001435 [Diatrype stigma]|uniref:Enoyl-CoA hydratase n=1 Tax=Diatrype stigma TaxID=117547 RepID=A0AAN9UYB3_9PEZI
MANFQSSDLVFTETPADGVRVITFNRLDKRNALSQSLITTFLKRLAEASLDNTIRVIIVTGSKSCFSAGADIKEISEMDAAEAGRRRYLEDLCLGIKAVKKPILAAVEGIALGGGFEVALMAMKMIMLGSSITAAEAHVNGLVAETFDDSTVLDNTIAIAEKLASSSSVALSFAKEAICGADDLGRNEDLERRLYYTSFGTADKREGISAFLQKRKPRWTKESRKNIGGYHHRGLATKSSAYFLRDLVMLPRTVGRAALGKEIAPTPWAV